MAIPAVFFCFAILYFATAILLNSYVFLWPYFEITWSKEALRLRTNQTPKQARVKICRVEPRARHYYFCCLPNTPSNYIFNMYHYSFMSYLSEHITKPKRKVWCIFFKIGHNLVIHQTFCFGPCGVFDYGHPCSRFFLYIPLNHTSFQVRQLKDLLSQPYQK
jgi:hypothetical protein